MIGATQNNSTSSSNAVATAVFADVNIAVAALQDILIMARVTHLASEAPPRPVMEDALKDWRMLAFMIVLQFGEDPVNTLTPLTRKYVWSRISIYDLFGALFNTMKICCSASALLPTHTTNVAELCTAWASALNQYLSCLKETPGIYVI